MTRPNTNEYLPDYAVPPGEVVNEYLEAYGMTQVELADRTGMAKKTVNQVVNGKAPITPATALKLERVFNRPARFWGNLEREYQDYLAFQRDGYQKLPKTLEDGHEQYQAFRWAEGYFLYHLMH
ncbi:MAG: HigA family addiction module antidote protein, partial [bacterium]|nr:HigA family addiction module antidote protein [bacterium]